MGLNLIQKIEFFYVIILIDKTYSILFNLIQKMVNQQTNKWMQELVSNFDNISVTNVSDTNYGDDNPNSAVMYTIFGKYHKLGPSMDEEDLIDEIQDATDVNWDEVSAIRKLSEFIMEEFSDQLNWVIVLFNRVMTKKIIDRFRKQLLIATKTPKVLDNLIDTKEKAMYVMLNVNEGMFNDIFNHVCVSGHVRLIELLLKDIRVTDDMFHSQFTDACQNGRTATVGVLLKDSRLTTDALNSGFISACGNDDHIIFDVLFTDPRITNDMINNGFINAYTVNNFRTVEILNTDPRITNDTINIAFGIVTKVYKTSRVLNQSILIILKHPYLTNNIFNQYVSSIYSTKYSHVKQPFDIEIYFDVLIQDQRITNKTLIVCFQYAYTRQNQNLNLLESMLKLNRNSVDFIAPVLINVFKHIDYKYDQMRQSSHNMSTVDHFQQEIVRIYITLNQFLKHDEVSLELLQSLRDTPLQNNIKYRRHDLRFSHTVGSSIRDEISRRGGQN